METTEKQQGFKKFNKHQHGNKKFDDKGRFPSRYSSSSKKPSHKPRLLVEAYRPKPGGYQKRKFEEEPPQMPKRIKFAGSEQEEVSSAEQKREEPEKGFLSDRDYSSCRLSPATLETLQEMGFSRMTHVQAKTIDPILHGRDVAASARTGSGKTLAFLVPVLERLAKEDGDPGKNTCVIVMSPTRELALQTFDVLRNLLQRHSNYTFGLLIGGVNRKVEIRMLYKGIHFLVATPGRLLDHLKTGAIKARALKCLIVDEADKLLEIGFLADVKEILHRLPNSRQTLLFSATINEQTQELMRVALKPSHISVGIEAKTSNIAATVEGLKQVYVPVPIKLRLVLLINLLRRQQDASKIMVFFSTSDSVIFHNLLLEAVGIPNLCIHGKQRQKKRTVIFYEFNKLERGILLCTDVAARGLDIPQVECVIQFDAPLSTKEYVHRVGRTARGADGTGNGILFLRPEEFRFVSHLHKDSVPITLLEVDWSKMKNVQSKLEEVVEQSDTLRKAAKTAHLNFIYSYACHNMKDCFSHKSLKHPDVATSFCLKEVPEFKPLKKRMTSTSVKDKPKKPAFKNKMAVNKNAADFSFKSNDIFIPREVKKKLKLKAQKNKQQESV